MSAASEPAPVEILFLGRFELKVQGRTVGPPPKAVQSLLLLLVTQRGRVTDRAQLAATLWPNSSPDLAAFYLRRAVTQLRNLLGNQRGRINSEPSIDLSDCRCDVLDFQSIRHHQPEAALKLYRGRISVGQNYAPIEALTENLHEKYLNTSIELARTDAARGAHDEAVARLRSLITTDPCCEGAWQELMRVHAEAGDFAALSRTYRHFRKRLGDELGLQPGPASASLFHQLMSLAPVAPVQGPRVTATLPLTGPSVPLTPLIGRDDDRNRLDQAVAKHRLVVVLGFGGVGKTRLAMDLVQRSQSAVAVSCAKWTSESEAVAAVAGALGVAELTRKELGDNELIVLLDNVENCLKAAGRIAQHLLTHAPNLRVVATSRRNVEWDGAMTLPLRPLAAPQSQLDVESSPSAELFIARATAANPAFALTAENSHAVASICRQLDGLPLAIELAALRVRSYTVHEIELRLSDRFSLLSGPSSRASLEAVLKWTLSVLSKRERSLLLQLSVFPEAWDREAAAAVCPGYSPDALETLVDVGLVMHNHGRFSRLETVRQYALKLKAPSEELCIRFAEHYVSQAGPPSDKALQWFLREQQNVIEVLRLPGRLDSAEVRRLAIELHNGSYWFWHQTGRVAEFGSLTQSLIRG